MPTAVIGALRVNLGMDSASFHRGARASETRLQSMQRRFRQAGQSMQRAGARLSIGLTAPLAAFARASVRAAGVQEQAEAQVRAALESMGDVSGRTFDQLTDQASRLQGVSLYGDEEILEKVTANLLTFGNISGDVFDRTQQAALDMSQRLGQDLQSSAVMLGKALNDPIAGLTALGRVGVQFTEEQKEQIRTMVAAGDVAAAQTLILAELESQYGGAARAAADTDSGKITQAWNAIGDAMETVGAIILPIVAQFAEKIKEAAEAFQALSLETQTMIVKALALAAALGPVLLMGGWLVSALAPLAGVFAAIVSPIGLLVIALGALAYAIYSNWEYIKTDFPAVAALIEGIGVSMGELFRAMLETIREVIDHVVSWLRNAVSMVESILNGDWRAAWGFALAAIQDVFGIIEAILIGWPAKFLTWAVDSIAQFVFGIENGAAALRQALADLWTAAREVLSGWVDAMFQIGANFIDRLISGIQSKLSVLRALMGDVGSSVANTIGGQLGVDAAPSAGYDDGVSVDDVMQLYNGAGGNQGRQYGDDFADGVRESLQIQSPSKVMKEIGRFIMQGMGIGISSEVGVPAAAMGAATYDIGNAVRGADIAGQFDQVGDAVEGMGDRASGVFGQFGGWLANLVTGATTLRQTLASAFSSSGNSAIQAGIGGLGDFFSGAFGDSIGGIAEGFIGGLMGFRDGGSFKVGGSGGTDSQVVAFRATPDETVSITRPDQQAMGRQAVARVEIVEAAGFAARVVDISGGVAVEAVESFDTQLPTRNQEIAKDGRVR